MARITTHKKVSAAPPRYTRSQLLAMVKHDPVRREISVQQVSGKTAQRVASAALLEMFALYFNAKVMSDKIAKLRDKINTLREENSEFATYIDELYSELETVKFQSEEPQQ